MQQLESGLAAIRPRRRVSGGGTSRRLRADAAAAVARAAPGRVVAPCFDGALPVIAKGAVLPSIEREPGLATRELALGLHDAGFRFDGRLPHDITPIGWILGALDRCVARHVPRLTYCCLHVGLLESADGGLAIGLELSPHETGALPMEPLFRTLPDEDARASACAIVNDTLMLMGPERLFDAHAHHNWMGEDDEEVVRQEYASQGEEYAGLTRAQWDEAYPEWTRRRRGRSIAAGLRTLHELAAGRARAAPAARALLALRQAISRRPLCREFFESGDNLEYDCIEPWGIPLIRSREENVTAFVLDQMFETMMQCCCDSALVRLRIPGPDDARRMRRFHHALAALLREFSAASDFCRCLSSLEKKSCMRS